MNRQSSLGSILCRYIIDGCITLHIVSTHSGMPMIRVPLSVQTAQFVLVSCYTLSLFLSSIAYISTFIPLISSPIPHSSNIQRFCQFLSDGVVAGCFQRYRGRGPFGLPRLSYNADTKHDELILYLHARRLEISRRVAFPD
jgi:hypothetical protein